MPDVYLTNTLTHKKERFEPIKPPKVGMYACGMTVYDYSHIGHGRKYVIDDVLKRLLVASGYKVKHVQNVTDVGHLSSDADEGEDKMEKGAAKAGRTVWETAQYFMDHFYASMDKLNVLRPDIICRATEHIEEQIEMVQKLLEKGFAYDTPEAVYFDVTKFPNYGALLGQRLEEKKVAVREEVKTGEHKKNPQDFALWFKRVGRFQDHVMHWKSPWGEGFPGWHIECSAMSIKYLGEQFDIHTGGEDHISIHHSNEIAQSEAATGKSPVVRYWLHTAFLMVNGQKMSKSLGNFYRVEDVEARGFEPLALRYFYLTANYRKPQNFTWEALKIAASSLEKLKGRLLALKSQGKREVLSNEKLRQTDEYRDGFLVAVGDDLNTPVALAILWEMLDSSLPSPDKYDLTLSFDEVLGLGLGQIKDYKLEITEEVKQLVNEREKLRQEGQFAEADKIRQEIAKKGFSLEDTPKGAKIKPL